MKVVVATIRKQIGICECGKPAQYHFIGYGKNRSKRERLVTIKNQERGVFDKEEETGICGDHMIQLFEYMYEPLAFVGVLKFSEFAASSQPVAVLWTDIVNKNRLTGLPYVELSDDLPIEEIGKQILERKEEEC